MAQLAIAGGQPIRTKPFPRWPAFDEADRERLSRVLDAPVWASDGPIEREFEKAFAARHDVPDAVTVTNGTVTLLLCLRALGIKPGDEVIVPALTWIATATCVIEANGVPVFAEVDPATYCLDPKSVESLVTPRTVAIIPVHLYSHMANMDELRRIADRHKLAIIEDCAHAHGSKWRGKSAGSIGDLGSFSFQSSKVMTSGEGGMITSQEKALLDACYSQKNCGRHRPDRGTPFFGGNHRMTEFQCAILMGQLSRLDDQMKQRDTQLERLRSQIVGLRGVKLLAPQTEVTQRPHYRFSFTYDKNEAGGVPLHKFVEAVRAEGIPVEQTYPVVYKNLLYKTDDLSWYNSGRGPLSVNRCPTSESISETSAFTLAHPALLGSSDDTDDIAKAFSKVLANADEAADLKSRLKDVAKDALRKFSR